MAVKRWYQGCLDVGELMDEMVYGFLGGWEMNSGTPLSRRNFIAGGYANRVVAHK